MGVAVCATLVVAAALNLREAVAGPSTGLTGTDADRGADSKSPVFVSAEEPTRREAPFRLCFLDSEPLLADTCKLLLQAGFPESTVAVYEKLVRAHNLSGNRVDRSRFPGLRDGFYEFASLEEMVSRLDRPFGQTPANPVHAQHSLTCFDVVALLLQGRGCGVPRLEETFSTSGIVLTAGAAPLRIGDYGTWYSNCRWLLYPESAYEQLVGRRRTIDEEQLNLALRAARSVDSALSSPDAMARESFSVFLSGMKQSGFVFPQQCEVGIAFFARPKAGYVFADHAFLCIRRHGRLICLEKVGSPGPYVRAEFASEDDLGRFVSWDELQAIRHSSDGADQSSVAVSLNDRLIGLWCGKDSKGRDTRLPQPVTAAHQPAVGSRRQQS